MKDCPNFNAPVLCFAIAAACALALVFILFYYYANRR